MSTEHSKAVVRRFNEEIISRGNFEAAEDIMAASFVDHTPSPGLSPDRDGVKNLFMGMRAAFPDLQSIIHEQVADGDRVATRKTLEGTHRGDLWGIPATGKHVAFGVTDIVRVVDGRMVDHWAVVDQLSLMQQLGVVPTPERAGS